MTYKPALLALAASMFFAGTSAEAAVYTFDLSGGHSASWTIDTDTFLDNYKEQGQGFGYYNVGGVFGRVAQTAYSINFFPVSNDGGLSIELDSGFIALTGAQLYTGGEQTPVFRIGSFGLTGVDGSRDATLSISSAAAVPEPATWLMTIAGFGIMGASLRARRTAVRLKIA